MTTHMKIVMATDDGFAMHTACLIASILANAEAHQEFTFYVLDGGITPDSKAKIEALKSIRDFEIQFIKLDFSALKFMPNLYWGLMTYSRLLIPELIPQEDKLLYLDVDMIVRGSLEELWNTDFEGKSLAVVMDACELYSETFFQSLRKTILGISKSKMFNAGMMLMNMKKIREEHSFQTTIRWLEDFSDIVLFVDQDGLNVIFREDRKLISSKWNTPSPPDLRPEFLGPPVIVHYCTKKKPSSYLYQGAYRDEYWKYLRMTPWKDFRLADYSWTKAVKRFFVQTLGLSSLVQFMAKRIVKHSPWLQAVFADRDYQRKEAWKLRLRTRQLIAKGTPWEAYFPDPAENDDLKQILN